MKSSLFISIFLFAGALYAQEKNLVTIDERTGSEILLGVCDRDGFILGQFADWFEVGYENYQPQPEVIGMIEEIGFEDITIRMVLGTWCPDSRREVPHFIRVLDEIGFDMERLTIISVDGYKKAPGIDIAEWDVEFVPTMVVYKDAQELGRIIEYPMESLEKDLLLMIQGE
jgi:thiol-disulfide isomerase/thioredoxin